MRIMGIDYGDARTGLAVSDAMNLLVGEAWTVNQWDANALADEIIRQAVARGVERFVLGLPKNMDGTEGARAEKMPRVCSPSRRQNRHSDRHVG